MLDEPRTWSVAPSSGTSATSPATIYQLNVLIIALKVTSFPWIITDIHCGLTAKSLPCWLSQFSFSKLIQPVGQRLSNVRTQQNFFSIKPILFLYYEESLVSSNLNSNLIWFHCVTPIVHTIGMLSWLSVCVLTIWYFRPFGNAGLQSPRHPPSP
jgi:hypothetical protein